MTSTVKIPEWWIETIVESLVNDKILEKPMDWNHGNLHPKSSDFTESWVPFIMASDISNGKVDFKNCYYISEATNNTLQKWFAKPWDVLLTHKATIWKVALLWNEYPSITLTPQVTYYRVLNHDKLDNKYLYYYFLSPYFQNIFAMWSWAWSTRAYLWITDQRKLPIILPPLPEQKAIAGVLSAFDDKIELLRAENQTLEEMGQTLFKEWFISPLAPWRGNWTEKNSSDPKKEKSPLGDLGAELPDGWKVGKQKDLIDLLNWFAYKSSDFVEWWKYKLVTIANVQDGNFVSETKDSLDIIPDKMPEYCHLKTWDILLSLTWNVWRVCLVIWENYFLNQRVAKISPKNENDYWFAYFYFRQKNMITILESISVWTAQQNLSPIKTSELELIIPNRNTLDEFWKVANKLFDKIVKNLEEIQTLAKTRDQLLPKLMSWEVRVHI